MSKNTFLYGSFEIRCKIPPDTWPAFWLFGQCGEEIDVFEFLCDDDDHIVKEEHFTITIHEDLVCTSAAPHLDHGEKQSPGPDYSIGFHKWTLIWTPDDIAVFVDYELVRKCSRSGNLIDNCLPFGRYPDNPMQVIISLGAHNDPCTPNGTNAVFEIDYVKIWDSTTPADCDGVAALITLASSNQNNFIHYSNYIQTAGTVNINQSSSILWTAGNYIDIFPGFEVNSDFEANIIPCMADCQWCRTIDTNPVSFNKESFNINNYGVTDMHSGFDHILSDTIVYVQKNAYESTLINIQPELKEVFIYDASG